MTVSWTHVLSADATVVRANALTRLDDGAYVVELVENPESAGDERTRFVPVEIGARSGSMVEIVTDLEPGAVLVAP